MAKISQREARRLLARVKALEAADRARHAAYGSEYPGGRNVAHVDLGDLTAGKLGVAQLLGHPLVARMDGNKLLIYALPENPAA